MVSNPAEILFLPEPNPRYNEVIDSSNMLSYLSFAWRASLPGNIIRFDQHIYLPQFREILQKTFQTYQTVNVFDEETRRKLITHPNLPPGMPDSVKDELSAFKKYNEMLAQTTSPGERGNVIYLDNNDDQIKTTGISFGEFTSVTFDFKPILDILNNGHSILNEVHTHPTSLLFSPIDYLPLVWDIYEKHGRVTNAVTVLCPDLQIMAVATPFTPLFTYDEALTFLDTYTKKIRNLQEATKLKIKKVMDIISRHFEQSSHLFIDYVNKVNQEKSQGSLSEDETDSLKKARMDNLLSASQSFASNAQKTAKLVKDYGQKRENALHMRLPRDLGVQLYFSNDFENFFAFYA